jgi:hypothetical protein
MKTSILFILALAFQGTLHAQLKPGKKEGNSHGHDNHGPIPEPEKIFWSKTKKITWNNYKKAYNHTMVNPLMTMISTHYIHYVTQKGDTLVVDNYPIFFPKDSYVKPELKTKTRLQHEQVLFDLYEVWARKLKKDIATASFSSHSYTVYLQSMHKTNLQNRNNEILKYRNETNYGENAAKQKEWAAKIQKELQELEKYNRNQIRVPVK